MIPPEDHTPQRLWRVRRCPTPLSADDQASASRLLMNLRTDLDADSARTFLQEATATGYEVALLSEGAGAEPGALAGFRILPTSRGRILLLEDLVVAGVHRGAGAGSALLEWLKTVAASARCARIELDTGVANVAAQRFYARHGMRNVAVHFSLDVDS